MAASLPKRAKKPERPRRTGVAYVLMDEEGAVLLIRRPEKGLLGGMMALPEAPPVEASWREAGVVLHVFTHFALSLSVKAALVPALPPGALRGPAATTPLPSVMRKALDAGRAALDDAP
jgi:A/G-specific adenine glycosylase